MKKLLLLILLLTTLTACQPAQAVLSTPSIISQPVEQKPTYPSTASPIPPAETPTEPPLPKPISKDTSEPTSSHTPEPTRALDLSGYKVLVGDCVNSLRPVAVNDEIIYLADQSFDMLFMISSEMIFELIPPFDELYILKEIKDLNTIRKTLYPQALMGEFVDRNEVNRAGCIVPLGITTGDEVLCGFNIIFKNSEVSVIVLGTTLREGVNTPVEESDGG